MSDHDSGSKPALLVIEEATGKCIRQLSLGEPYPGSQEIDLVINFDDGTQLAIEIDVASRLSFEIEHLSPDSKGEMEPVKKSRKGSLRALAKQQGNRGIGKSRTRGSRA